MVPKSCYEKQDISRDSLPANYPHIYGPLNRDAIVKIINMERDRKGDWSFPFNKTIK